MTASLFIFSSTVAAENVAELEKQKSSVKTEQDNKQSEINESSERLSKNHNTQDEVQAEIDRIDLEINDIAKQIEAKNDLVIDLEAKIVEEISKIEAIETEIQRRDEIIRERLVKSQAGGWNVSYLEVILGANSFADFLERASIISKLLQSDRTILEQQSKSHIELQSVKENLEKQQAEVEASKEQLEILIGNSKTKKNEKEGFMKQLDIESHELEDLIFSKEEEQQILIDQEREISRLIELENKRIAEEQKRAEAEAKKAALDNKAGSGSSGGSGGGSNGDNNQATPPATNTTYMNPAVGVISSYYGKRGSEFHYGIDIANKNANVPIVAVADGIVTSSYYSTSYGNVVMVSHAVNGEIITSLYAHMEVRNVALGKQVVKGDKLGIMGNTGNSFGQHLHFEMMKGRWQANHANTFDPLPYLNY